MLPMLYFTEDFIMKTDVKNQCKIHFTWPVKIELQKSLPPRQFILLSFSKAGSFLIISKSIFCDLKKMDKWIYPILTSRVYFFVA